MRAVLGVHHVTAMAKDAAENRRFYNETLGLRLVKKTVNYDDPSTLHLYYADEGGSPGRVLTHFPNPGLARGVAGAGEVARTGLVLPRETTERMGVGPGPATIDDPDGMSFRIESGDGPPRIGSVTLRVAETGPTAEFLSGVLGLERSGEELVMGDGSRVLLEAAGTRDRPRLGAGSVHHVAFRVADEGHLTELQAGLAAAGAAPTEVKDRSYFRSVYFREPGGVVIELATDGPGFDADEPAETMGSSLMLPSGLEANRSELVARLERAYGRGIV